MAEQTAIWVGVIEWSDDSQDIYIDADRSLDTLHDHLREVIEDGVTEYDGEVFEYVVRRKGDGSPWHEWHRELHELDGTPWVTIAERRI